MISFIRSILISLVSFYVEKVWGALFPAKLSAQRAVSTETKMAQDIADTPSQVEAVKALNDGNA
jgi:hypothetical protein